MLAAVCISSMLLFDLSACSWRFSLKSLLIWICNNKGSSCGLVNVTVALSIPIGLVTVVLSIRLVWLDVLNWDLLLSKYVRSHLTGRCWHSHVWPRVTATPQHLPLTETRPRASSSPLPFTIWRRQTLSHTWRASSSKQEWRNFAHTRSAILEFCGNINPYCESDAASCRSGTSGGF